MVRRLKEIGVNEIACLIDFGIDNSTIVSNLIHLKELGERSRSLLPLTEVRASLKQQLPEYMVPEAIVELDALPLTSNGKLDRKALPEPGADAYLVRGYEAPVGEIETILACIWVDVLKQEQVGRQDNFFELGGHSLLAMRVVARLRRNWLRSGRARSSHTPLADLAHALETPHAPICHSIVPVERSEALPLSFAQQRLWFLAQMEGVSEAYHIRFGRRLVGELDRAALRRSLDRIVFRHEALRTSFVLQDGQPVQRIAAANNSRFHLLEHDLCQHSDARGELERLMAQEARASFDLTHGPLIRGRLIRLSEEEHVLLITMHHIVSDGWSMGVLVNELSALYSAFLRGESDPLSELEIQYADYAVWQRKWIEGDVLRQQGEYWTSSLSGVPALLELPTDYVRPAQQDYAGGFAELSSG